MIQFALTTIFSSRRCTGLGPHATLIRSVTRRVTSQTDSLVEFLVLRVRLSFKFDKWLRRCRRLASSCRRAMDASSRGAWGRWSGGCARPPLRQGVRCDTDAGARKRRDERTGGLATIHISPTHLHPRDSFSSSTAPWRRRDYHARRPPMLARHPQCLGAPA